MSSIARFCMVAATFVALTACGGGDDEAGSPRSQTPPPVVQPPPSPPTSPAPPPAPPAPLPVGTVIGPAGGTVTAGGASLVIPPGALTQDVTITVAVSSPTATLPDAATIQGMVF